MRFRASLAAIGSIVVGSCIPYGPANYPYLARLPQIDCRFPKGPIEREACLEQLGPPSRVTALPITPPSAGLPAQALSIETLEYAKEKSSDLFITMNAYVNSSRRPNVYGHTDLPDGTKLVVFILPSWLPDGKERLRNGLTACGLDYCGPVQSRNDNGQLSDDPVVRNGYFETGAFTIGNADLAPSNYTIEIAMYSNAQSDDVKRVLGKSGENMKGQLVDACCFSDQNPEDREKNMRNITDLEKLGGGKDIYYWRAFTIR